MNAHPASEIFPMRLEHEVQALANDIREHGLRTPIGVLDGQILDGRARFRACAIAGVEAVMQVVETDDPLAFVVIKNLEQRQLSASQRAMVAARIATLPRGAPFGTSPQGKEAAMLMVHISYVARARRLLEQGPPELVADIEGGTVTISAAYKQTFSTENAIPRKDPRKERTRHFDAKVSDLIAEGLNMSEIASALGVRPSAITESKRRLGLTKRSQSRMNPVIRMRDKAAGFADDCQLAISNFMPEWSNASPEQIEEWIAELQRGKIKIDCLVRKLSKVKKLERPNSDKVRKG